VGPDTRPWTEGKCMLFDDSFEHEVWYRPQHVQKETDSDSLFDPLVTPERKDSKSEEEECEIINKRVVLLLDFWNPLLTDYEIFVLKKCLPADSGFSP